MKRDRSRGGWRWLGLLLATVQLIGATTAVAGQNDVQVKPLCPATVTRGGQLRVDFRLTNNLRSPVPIATSGFAVHLANLNVYGPFVVPLTVTLSTFQTITRTGYIDVTFPSDTPGGTFASVGVFVLDSGNNSLGAGGCLIRVQ